MILSQLTTPGPVNLVLPIPAHADLHLNALVRVLSGRRWVFSAEWQSQAVFAKVFAGKQASRYANRDAAGAMHMQAAGIRTPALLWQGVINDAGQTLHILVYAAIPAASNVADVFLTAQASQKKQLLVGLAQVLAAQHAAGLCQTDLHLNNFLLSGHEIWAIDGDGIRRRTLTRSQSMRDLAVLVSKLQVLDQVRMVAEVCQSYLQCRGWTQAVTDAGRLLARAMALKTREVEAYVRRKIFRRCSDVLWQQYAGMAQAVSIRGALQPTDIDALESAMQQGTLLKQGNTCTVTQATLQGRSLVIKRYNIKDLWHACSRAWRPSRAAASWANAHRLQYYGLTTPQPLLMLEQRRFGLRGKAYFVAEYSPWPDALTFFRQTADKRLRAEALKQLSLCCYQLYLLRLSHGDMKATNLQITDQGQVIVMDLDSMRQHRCAATALRAHVRDLRRLLQNWKDDTSLYNALLKSLRVVYDDPTPLQRAGISI